MDLIERIFHVSPDHGNGALEAILALAILAVPIAWAVLRRASAIRTRLATLAWALRTARIAGELHRDANCSSPLTDR
jgi:hypothetical protein